MENSIIYKLDWGNPYFLMNILKQLQLPVFQHRIEDMYYGPYEGNHDLINATKRVIEQTMGRYYNHIIITNGASGALNLIFRRFYAKGGKTVYTSEYGYPSYDSFIERAGLERFKDLSVPIISGDLRKIRLIDSPENPTGKQFSLGDASSDIWDSAYNSKIYVGNPFVSPGHRIMVGTYSKLLGVAGARVGFIATNDSLSYQDLAEEAKDEYTGCSKPSQEMVVQILNSLDLDNFIQLGAADLCYNREEMQKIEYLFDGQEVNAQGMFYAVKAEKKATDTLHKAGVSFVRLDADTIRLSMGQVKEVTRDAVRAILKEDGK